MNVGNNMKWKIGNIEIKNQVCLAPMAGVSNPSYMKLCEEMGVGYAVTELISAEGIVRGNHKTFEMLNGMEKLKIPIAVQIFGSNPETMTNAAKILVQNYHVKIIDINMGCPVPKVALRSQSGSALLKDPKKVKEIVESVTQSVSVPVTVKIRSGWDSEHRNAVEIAKIIEKAGAMAITVHGRTRAQGYSGTADWGIIKEVKEHVKIPVIGNGDIKSCYDVKRMLEETSVDAVMIGRAALGNPWLIKECVEYLEHGTLPKEVTKKEKFDMILKHMNYLLEIKPEKVAILELRSHAAWYLKGLPGMTELKQKIFSSKTKEEIIKLLKEYEG